MKLALFFTNGVSLQTWDSVGMLNREVALYKELQKRGVGTEFVTYGDAREKEMLDQLPGFGLRSNRFSLPDEIYKRALKTWPPKADVFKSNQLLGADVALASARKAKIPFIARCGYLPSLMDAARYGEESRQAQMARNYERNLLPKADKVVVTTTLAAKTIIEEYGVVSDKVNVIPNYVETELFGLSDAENNRIKVGCVGRLEYQKNLPALVEAICPLDVELVIVGDGTDRARLIEMAKGARATITLLGNIPNRELPQLLAGLDLFVLPSLYEGHPKALLEAMSCGIAVIGTRVQGIQEIIEDGDNGLLCDVDALSIRNAVQSLMSDRGRRERLGKAAREFVVGHFSLSQIVEKELSLLSEIVA